MGKSLLGSKTFWLNLLSIIVPIATPALQSHPKVYVGVVGGLNIANRFLTGEPITSIFGIK